MRRFFNKIKRKYDIKSDFQLVVINIVFAISGSTSLFARRGLFYFFGIDEQTSIIIKVLTYIGTVVPSYFIILLFVGTVFGQFRFFWKFEKRMVARFIPKRM
jgi:hypothetical protein